MHNETYPSLLLPKLTAILLVVIFLSGITEIVCLTTYARQTKYETENVSLKLNGKTNQTNLPVETQYNTEVLN
jgi:hypothetical protein